MSQLNRFDVVVLGGGPGGYTAAFRAADSGCCLGQRKSILTKKKIAEYVASLQSD